MIQPVADRLAGGAAVYHRVVDEGERAALERASRGARFGAVCESPLASHGEEAAVAQAYAWVSTWLADGMIRSPATRRGSDVEA